MLSRRKKAKRDPTEKMENTATAMSMLACRPLMGMTVKVLLPLSGLVWPNATWLPAASRAYARTKYCAPGTDLASLYVVEPVGANGTVAILYKHVLSKLRLSTVLRHDRSTWLTLAKHNLVWILE